MKKIFSLLLVLSISTPCFANNSDRDLRTQVSTSNPTQLISAKKKDPKTAKIEAKKEEIKKPKVIVESEYEPAFLGSLLDNPEKYIGKKIKFRGKFSSFTTLALDYDPALRKSKDYISLCIFRPDTKIPLSELKLAYPLSEAKENLVIRDVEEGDLIEFYGQVFSAALGEPWVDVDSIKNLNLTKKEKIAEKTEKSKDATKKDTKKSKK
jgi:hypothetical protein